MIVLFVEILIPRFESARQSIFTIQITIVAFYFFHGGRAVASGQHTLFYGMV